MHIYYCRVQCQVYIALIHFALTLVFGVAVLQAVLYSPLQPKPADQNEDTNDMAQLNPDWQVSKKCVKERTSVMFNNELIADVHFIVGSGSTQRRIPAHKFILATGSPVFYAMFYGGLAKDKKEVTIPDVEPQAFLNILRWVYCRRNESLWKSEICLKCIDSHCTQSIRAKVRLGYFQWYSETCL